MAKSRGRKFAEITSPSSGVFDLTSVPTITNAKLQNSAMTLAGSSVSLGGTGVANTDALSEGSSNLYFTDARVQTFLGGGTLAGNIVVPDNRSIYVGSSSDFRIVHNVNNTQLTNATGALQITSNGGVTVTGATTFSADLTVDTSTLKVDSSNNRVGIGTATPATPLHTIGITTFDGDGASRAEITSSTASSVVSLDVGGFNGIPSVARDIRFLTNAAANAKTERMRISSAGHFIPASDSAYNIGANGTRFANAYFDTVYGTLATAAQPNITSVGTLTGLTVSGNVTVSTSSGTALTVSGNFPRLYFVDTAGSDLDAYIVNNANGLFFGKTNSPTASNDVMMLDLTNQRVGIGTSSPLAALSVGAGSLTDASLPVQISTGADGTQAWYAVNRNGGYGALFGYSASSTYKGLVLRNVVASGTANADGISFMTNNTNIRMHITGAGNVGIGTTDPQHRLDVESGANQFDLFRVGSSTSDNSEVTIGYFDANAGNGIPGLIGASDFGGLIQGGEHGNLVLGIRDNDTTDGIAILSGGGNFMSDSTYDTIVAKFRADGNVGIGTNTPLGLFTIRGTGDAIRVESTNTGAGGAQLDLLHFTTSPADNDTPGSINFGGYYSGTSSAYSAAIRSIWTDVSAREGKLAFFTRDDGTFDERLTITHDGKVTVAAGKFLYTDYIRGTSDINTGINMAGSDILELQTGGTERIRITATGDVKVGPLAITSATSAPLHVAKANTNVQAIFGDNNSTIDDPSIRIIGRDTANSTARYTFIGLDADNNHGFIGYNAGSGAFQNALHFHTSGDTSIGYIHTNNSFSDKRTGTNGLQINQPGRDNIGGHLFMTQQAAQNDWRTICRAHDIGATGMTFLMNATREADQNRHCTRLVRYAYNQTFTEITVSQQNTAVEYRVTSSGDLQYRFTTGGPYSVTLIVMADG